METIINYNQEDDTASVYTYDQKLKDKLMELSARFPDKFKQLQKSRTGPASYLVPKNCVTIRVRSLMNAEKQASERGQSSRI
jgi:hypothetical protein